MLKKLFHLCFCVLILTALTCGSNDSSTTTTPTDVRLEANYEASVAKVAPNVTTESGTTSKAITDTGVTCAGSAVLDSIRSDAELYKDWVGWDNNNGGILSPSAPDGWMPFKEDDNDCSYIDEENNKDGSAIPDGVPDLKNYAVLNKVFFGGGSDTIYGSAKTLDELINMINESVDTSNETPAVLTLPSWFGNVYTDESTSTNQISVANLIDMSSSLPSEYGISSMNLAYSIDDSTGEQVVLIYMISSGDSSAEPQVSLFYARRDDSNSLYIKSSFIDFDSSSIWASSHIAELRTLNSDFIIRKANKIFGTGEPCCPAGSIYSHAVIGGGNIEPGSIFVLRWYEGRYDYASYTETDQPTVTQMRAAPVLSSDLYFIVEFDPNAAYNAKFKPLYGDGISGGATAALAEDLSTDTNATGFFALKPECAAYTNPDQLFTQNELPGWENQGLADFSSWTTQ